MLSDIGGSLSHSATLVASITRGLSWECFVGRLDRFMAHSWCAMEMTGSYSVQEGMTPAFALVQSWSLLPWTRCSMFNTRCQYHTVVVHTTTTHSAVKISLRLGGISLDPGPPLISVRYLTVSLIVCLFWGDAHRERSTSCRVDVCRRV